MDYRENTPNFLGDDSIRFSRISAPQADWSSSVTGATREATPSGSFEKHWLRTLAHVLTEEIQELYSAEAMLLKAIPMMIPASADLILRKSCEIHLESTLLHLRRLEHVMQMLGLAFDGRTCLAMEGLVQGLRETIQENQAGACRNLAMISAARKIKQFEVSSYCDARDFAQLLGLGPVIDLLQNTLDEETMTEAKYANLEVLMAGHTQ